MAWFTLIIAGFLEAFGVAMINQWHTKRKWTSLVLLFIGFGLSLVLLSYSMRVIPMGTAYAIWTGMGVVGGTIIGMFFYGESKDWKRLFFIGIVISSAIGLKLVS
ncbi:DMT family transporter [Robertmurraya massiliosenegalensis]|uniref:DMT family transporter n=1 Tax=Robertmurraya massiliosenegalensis TaxID=1287657 RepID=UPI00030F49EA|nr:multidrug efflux SMR transporter [Robertmurraya massiliosenegalensis]